MRARACSTSLPYSTAEGQAVSQARQSRHLSMCSTKDFVICGRAAFGVLGPKATAPPAVPFPFVGEDEEFTTEGAELAEPDAGTGGCSEPMAARSVCAT